MSLMSKYHERLGVCALAQPFHGARRNGDGREAWRTAQSLLRATVGDVDAGLVDFDGHGAERGDAVGDDQRAHFMRGRADGFAALEGAGGGFGLDVGHDLRLLALDEVAGFVVGEDFAPGLLEAHDLGALTARHLGLAVAEVAVGEDDDLRSRLDEVADRGFHAAAAGGGDDEGLLILGAEDGAQQALNVGGDFEEVGIEMPDDGLRHGLVNARMNLSGTGAVEQTLGRMNDGFFHECRFGNSSGHEGSFSQRWMFLW